MFDYLEKLSKLERLEYYVNYLKNRDHYSPGDQEKLDRYFEDS
ncbi:hypothetical protein JM79_2723 [Gramella sp. Hel_I_59]|nr:hypothetical protein [Gramella sp. Hel_I_59]TQI71775.1 hypothetical protein JM79_2723 [Gramella sp. Hel_I_59]